MNLISKTAIAFALAGVVYLLYPSDKGTPTAAVSKSPSSTQDAGPSFALPSAAQYAPQTQAQTRQAVFEPGPNGEPLVDATTAARLDLLLAELPGRATWQDLQGMEARVKEGLPERGQAQAARILNAYAAYRKAEAELEAQPRTADPAAPEAMLNQLVALRRIHLGPQVADAMFAAQEAQARVGIQSARIEADPNLSARDKSARIAALTKSLPPEIAAQMQDDGTQAARALEEQVAVLRERGASETQVWQLRQQTLGAEEAQAVTDMETQKRDWERRYRAFAQQKNMILSSAASPEQKQANVEALLRQHYTDQEMDTARAYDRGNGR